MRNPSLDKIMENNLGKTRNVRSSAQASLPSNGWLSKYDDGGFATTDTTTVAPSDAERQFITNWNNSPMAQQMLQTSVDKDDPWGRNSAYVKDITNTRNALTKKAQIKLLPQDQLIKQHDSIPGGSPAGPGLGGYATTQINKPKAVASAFLNMVTTPFVANMIGNNKAYTAVDATNFNAVQPKIYTNKDNLDQILETNLHELSHASDFNGRLIPDSDVKKMDVFARGIKGAPGTILDDFQQYVAEPTETRARLMNFRYNAANQKLYNPFKEKITLDQLRNYKTTPGGYDPLMQLRDVYSDEEILNLLNSVSKTNNGQQQTTAKFGGMYDDGGFTTTDTTTSPVNVNVSNLNNVEWGKLQNQFANKPVRTSPTSTIQEKPLESGWIVDRATGKMHIIKNNKPSKAYNVLTGRSTEGMVNPEIFYPEENMKVQDQATVPGYYILNPQGYNMSKEDIEKHKNKIRVTTPISAFGYNAPDASGISLYQTEPAVHKNDFNNYPNSVAYTEAMKNIGTHGCIGTDCNKPQDWNDLNNASSSDTLRIYDSRTNQGKAYGKLYGFKKGGQTNSWLNKYL